MKILFNCSFRHRNSTIDTYKIFFSFSHVCSSLPFFSKNSTKNMPFFFYFGFLLERNPCRSRAAQTHTEKIIFYMCTNFLAFLALQLIFMFFLGILSLFGYQKFQNYFWGFSGSKKIFGVFGVFKNFYGAHPDRKSSIPHKICDNE